MDTTPNTRPIPTIKDLINLLDDQTLDVLAHRLNQVLIDPTFSDKSQLLFEYIEAGILAEEEYQICPDRLVVVEALLQHIHPKTKTHHHEQPVQ